MKEYLKLTNFKFQIETMLKINNFELQEKTKNLIKQELVKSNSIVKFLFLFETNRIMMMMMMIGCCLC